MVNRLGLYKIFNEVVKYQNFSKAAKPLYMTQPAVSQAIMQLEDKLDVKLFNRTSRGVLVTKEGKLLYEYINSAINLINAGEKKIQESKDLMIGELLIGVGDTISRYFLLPYLELFHTKYPDIKLKIINRTTIELQSLLKSGEIDIAICNLPIEDSSIKIKKCMEVEDIFVCGDKYKDQFIEPISLKDLIEFPIILLENKSNSRQYINKHLVSQGVKVNPEIELGSHELLLEFASINLGIACVIEEFSKDYIKSKKVFKIPLQKPIPKRGIGYCFLKSVSLSPAAQEFLKILQNKEKEI